MEEEQKRSSDFLSDTTCDVLGLMGLSEDNGTYGTPKPKSLSLFPFISLFKMVFGLFMSTFSIRYVQEASNMGLCFCSGFCMLSFPKSHHNHFYTFDGERWCWSSLEASSQKDWAILLSAHFIPFPNCIYWLWISIAYTISIDPILCLLHARYLVLSPTATSPTSIPLYC